MTYSDRNKPHHYPSELSRGNYTLEEIADMMGLTRERVRQIEAMALRKLRRELRRRGLDDSSLLIPDDCPDLDKK
jgi:hypothetical protein